MNHRKQPMKSLNQTETTFVSGGFVNTWPAARRIGLPTTGTDVTHAALTTVAAPQSNDSPSRMAPASGIVDHYLPSMRFDADRMAPSGIDDDTYNGLNDHGLGI